MMCIKILSNSLANQISFGAFKSKSQTQLKKFNLTYVMSISLCNVLFFCSFLWINHIEKCNLITFFFTAVAFQYTNAKWDLLWNCSLAVNKVNVQLKEPRGDPNGWS